MVGPKNGVEVQNNLLAAKKKNGKNNTHLKIFVKVVFCIHINIPIDFFFFKCEKLLLVTVILKVSEISLKPQSQTVVLQFSLELQFVTMVSKLFLIRSVLIVL